MDFRFGTRPPHGCNRLLAAFGFGSLPGKWMVFAELPVHKIALRITQPRHHKITGKVEFANRYLCEIREDLRVLLLDPRIHYGIALSCWTTLDRKRQAGVCLKKSDIRFSA